MKPKRKKKEPHVASHPDAPALLAAYQKHRTSAKTIPTGEPARLVDRALEAKGLATCTGLIRWLFTADQKRAVDQRDGGYIGLDNLFRQNALESKIAAMESWQANPTPQRSRNGQPVYRNKPGSRDITPEMEADFEKYKIEMKERGIG